MKDLAVAGFLVLGLLLLAFHKRLTDFQMMMYRRSLPVAFSSGVFRTLDDVLTILIGVGFVAASVGYFLGYLR